MDAPSPKPRESAEGLAEVERALSVLHGRHPETERLRREDEERRAKRQAEQSRASRIESRRILGRRLVIGGGAALAAILALGATLVFRSEVARRSRIERATDPYRAMGFVLVESASGEATSKIEADVAAGCLVATLTGRSEKGSGSEKGGPRLQLALPGGGSLEGASPLVTCLCEAGRVTLSATGPTKTDDGLALLRADVSSVGGSRAFAFLPFEPGAAGTSDQACAEASLDAWLDAKRAAGDERGPASVVDAALRDAWQAADPARQILRDTGLELAAVVKPGAPFTTVDLPAGSCLLAVPERAAADGTSVRLKGGAIAVASAASAQGSGVAWCASAETSVVVQRDVAEPSAGAGRARGSIAVLVGPASRAGGLEGLRELAELAHVQVSAAGVAAGDLGWSAKSFLVASAVPEHLVTTASGARLLDLGADPEARIVALASERPRMISVETPADVFSFCEPALDAAPGSVCVFSGPQKWRLEGADASGGVARSRLPFWLFALQGVNEPVVLKMETQLLSLARRLRRQGFEPTTIEAVTELDKGAEVLGRANEDAMVAVGLAPSPPWILPYTDGPPWTIDGEPRVVPIRPLERVVVTDPSRAKSYPPKASRRTVVFRRTKR